MVLATLTSTLVRNATVVGVVLVVLITVSAYVAAQRRLAPREPHSAA